MLSYTGSALDWTVWVQMYALLQQISRHHTSPGISPSAPFCHHREEVKDQRSEHVLLKPLHLHPIDPPPPCPILGNTDYVVRHQAQKVSGAVPPETNLHLHQPCVPAVSTDPEKEPTCPRDRTL